MALPSQSAIAVASLATLAALPFGIYWLISVGTISSAVLFKSYFSECLQSLFDAWVQATSTKSADISADGYGHITYQTKDVSQTPSTDVFRSSKRTPVLPVTGGYSPPLRHDGTGTGIFQYGPIESRMNLSTNHFGSKWSPPPASGKHELESAPSPKVRDESHDHVWEIHRAAMSKAKQEGKISRAPLESRQVESTPQSVNAVVSTGPQEMNESIPVPVQRSKRPYVPDADVVTKRIRHEKYVEFASKASKRSLEDSEHGQITKRQFVRTPIKVDEMTASLSSSARKPARKVALDDSYVVCKKCKRVDDDSIVSESPLNGSVHDESRLMNVTMEEAAVETKAEETNVADVTSHTTSSLPLRVKVRPTFETKEEKVITSQKVVTSEDLKKDREIDNERYNSFKKAWRKAIGVKFSEEPEVKLITPSPAVQETPPLTSVDTKGSAIQFGAQTPGISLKPSEKGTSGFSFTPALVSTSSPVVSTAPIASVPAPFSFGATSTSQSTTAPSQPSVSLAPSLTFGTVSAAPQTATAVTLTQAEKPKEAVTVPKPVETTAAGVTAVTTVPPPTFAAPQQAAAVTSVATTAASVTAAPAVFGQKPAGALAFSFGTGATAPSASTASTAPITSAASTTTAGGFSGFNPQPAQTITTQASLAAPITSTGFSFGQPSTAQSSFAFGLTQQKAGGGVTKPTTTTQQPGGFSFGAPSTTSVPSFPTLSTTPASSAATLAPLPTATVASAFGFGAPAKPAATSAFGASQPPAFGVTPSTSAPAFGGTTTVFGGTAGFGAQSATTATTTSSVFSFGSNTASTAAPSFGTTTTTFSGFGSQSQLPAFGASTTTSGSTAFGTPKSTFGGGAFAAPVAPSVTTAPSIAAPAAPPAFSFGQSATSPPAFGATAPGFGQASSPPTFGKTGSTSSFGETSATPTFGASASTFGQSSSTPSFGQISSNQAFGASSPPAFGQAGTNLNFGQSTPFGGSSSGVNPSFSFGGPALPAISNPFSTQPVTVNLSDQQRQRRLARMRTKR